MCMEVKKELSRKPSFGLRLLQIGVGVIAIGLAISAMIYPSVGVATVSFLLAVALIVIGIERIVTVFASYHSKSSRVGNVILGAIVVGLGATVLAFPLYATGFIAILLSFGLLFAGIARVIQGSTSRNSSKTSRGLAIGVGVLAIAISLMIFAAPSIGIVLLDLIVAIGLLIIGIECIAQAISGRRLSSRSITT
jgi:uncharacterized membrane protein HdeD (DUF308 family)